MKRRMLLFAMLLVTSSLLLVRCGKIPFPNPGGGSDGDHEFANPSTVLLWNQASADAITKAGSGPTAITPMVDSRIGAMVNVAIHDALNSIKPKYKTYALKSALDKKANPDAAVAKAAHDVIAYLLPTQAAFVDGLYQTSMASIPDGDSKTRGIAIGKAAADAIIAERLNDGSEIAQFPYTGGTNPGEYRATPPFDGPPTNGFVAFPGWGKIKPFVTTSNSQFRVKPPYAINSNDYTKDFKEIKTLGAAVGSTRTADQTQIGLFWLENPPHSWNRLARALANEHNFDAWKTARLLALIQLAEADANMGCFDSKFFYNFWRPITAVRLGDSDGNPNTVGDTAWNVLAPPTPPVPDYPSNHATGGAAAAEVLEEFFGTDDISFDVTSTSLPNVTRHYSSLSQAARDNSLSRIYVGYHFRNAVMKGEDLGRKIGKWVMTHALQEN